MLIFQLFIKEFKKIMKNFKKLLNKREFASSGMWRVVE